MLYNQKLLEIYNGALCNSVNCHDKELSLILAGTLNSSLVFCAPHFHEPTVLRNIEKPEKSH